MSESASVEIRWPIPAARRSPWVSLGGFLIALTGVLVATSLVNTSSSGLPVFYLVVLIPLFSAVNPRSVFLAGKAPRPEAALYLCTALLAIALLIVTFVQTIWFTLDFSLQTVHLFSRLMFLVYFAICVRYVRGRIAFRTLVWLRRLLVGCFLYGIYQLPAKFLGLPLFLDWLRNNKSYSFYDYDASGWIAMVRSSSIFAEPSQATIPVAVAILLNIRLPLGKYSRSFGWVAISIFTLTCASRSVWITLLALLIGYNLWRFRRLRPWLAGRKPVPLIALVTIVFITPWWAFVASRSPNADLSAQERSGGIVAGIYTSLRSPLIGFGWNSAFERTSDDLRTGALPNASNVEGRFIDNMLVSYWEQAGIAGMALALFPLIVVWTWSVASQELRWGTLLAFVAAGGFGGDIGYMSMTWLWMALMVNIGTTAHSAGQGQNQAHSPLPADHSRFSPARLASSHTA